MTKKPVKPVGVMIVGDHAVVLEGLRNFLGQVPEVHVVAVAKRPLPSLPKQIRKWCSWTSSCQA